MEGRIHEIPEGFSMTEPLSLRFQADGICSNSSASCSMSHRTEDISVREDEDGIRSHLCPFDKIQDSDKEDNEADPDKPMKVDFDIDEMIKGCNLKSDEIPYLQAERPPLSDSDENTSSDVDASTAMIYAPFHNPSSIKSSEYLGYCPKHEVKILRYRKLREKTMARWNEDSSDDNEYFTSDELEKELLLKKFATGDESDLEEFTETLEIENIKYEKLESSHDESKTAKKLYETIMVQNEQTGGKTEYSQLISDDNKLNKSHSDESNNLNESHSDEGNNLNESHSDEGNNLNESHPEESDNRASQLETRQSIKEKEPAEHIEANNDSNSSASNKKFEVLKSDPPAALLGVITNDGDCIMKEILKLFDSMLDSVSKDVCMKNNESLKPDVHFGKDSDPLKTENSATVIRNNEIAHAVSVHNVTAEYKKMKPDDLEMNVSAKEEDKNQEVSSDHHTLPQTDTEIKDKADEKKNDLGEPTASRGQEILKDEEIHPDLATALRFMTEVYHIKDDEEFYSDTLSMSDMSVEVSMTEKSEGAVIFENYQPKSQKEETAKRSSNISIEYPSKSSTFEPVKTEEQKTVTRPRNKFSKFFKSFKKKLVKKD